MAQKISDDNHAWSLLEAELDEWVSSNQIASLWWRDDDASAPGPKLDQLVEMTASTGLLLAVIPASMHSTLASSLRNTPHVRIAQHGYAHINHAQRGQGQGAWELGLHRGLDKVLQDLDAGHAILQDSCGDDFLPVVVPPWNRIAAELFKPIASRGYCGVSAFGPRDSAIVGCASGMRIVNAHCDPIRWKSGACFAGLPKTIDQLVGHLRARRVGSADAAEPTGFLTHHIDLDTEGWVFAARLATVINEHPGAQWLTPDDIFTQNP